MRSVKILSLSTVFIFALWALCFWGLYRMGTAQPHGLWALASIATVVAMMVLMIAWGAVVIWQGHQRLAVIGWMLIGVSPSALFGGHWLDRHQLVSQRQGAPATLVDRVCSCWALSLMHAISWVRFSRTVHGKHIILIDNGQTPNARQLVNELDEHVVAMSKLLGESVPEQPVHWVRGSLFNLNAHSFGVWAFCERDGDVGNVTDLDRHEAAHSLIFALSGPDHDPPHLLIEGWAQSRSSDRDEMITSLYSEVESNRNYGLDELVQPFWYSRFVGPVYSHGGPFATYLIEEYSPETFFRLYHQTRRESFQDNIAEVLGVTWPQLESDFWRWLEDEATQIQQRDRPPESEHPIAIEFADESDREDWHALQQRYKTTQWANMKYRPEDVAIAFEAKGKYRSSEKTYRQTIEASFKGKYCWIRQREYYPESSQYVMFSQDACADLHIDSDGVLTGYSTGLVEQGPVRAEARSVVQSMYYSSYCNPGNVLPLRSDSNLFLERLRIKSLQPPTESERRWHVRFHKWIRSGGNHESVEEIGEAWLDESMDLIVTRKIIDQKPSGIRFDVETTPTRVGGMIFPESSRAISTGPGVDDGSQLETHLQILTASEESALRSAVRKQAQAIDTRPGRPWTDYPRVAIALVPILGISLVLFAPGRPSRRESES